MAIQLHAIEADFIVIGAGSAGCAIAARLSEDPATRVLLFEAGGEDHNRWIHIPLGFGKTFADPSVNWCYETEPDPGAGDRRVYWPRGKVLGGSSSINGMVYIRGQAEDFDHWRQLGNTGWSFDDVLPYFKRAEHQTRGADEFHGTDGPLCVSDVPDHHPICEAFIEAAVALGFPRNDDFNGARQDGAGYHQTTTRNGRRCSTAVGYLRPAMQRRNLQVVTEALSDKILFEGRRAVPDVKLSIQPFSADRPQDGLHPWSGFSMIAYQLRPDSRGEIKLRSADPSAAPAVHPNYLTAETDQQTIVAGLRLCRQLLAQAALAQFVASEYLPGAAVQSDAELLDFARRRGGTVYHPTSTCKMGIDALAVVDPELRVRGVTRLRVADASIMPTVISGNTNAATIMIGERCADLVRQELRMAA
jgi:choline dehydrogenase-like flavoprotein